MSMKIFYDGVKVGTRRVDFFVEEIIMVEIKAVIELQDVHLAQAMNYCQVYNLPVGLLINFGARSLEFKRVYNPILINPNSGSGWYNCKSRYRIDFKGSE